MNSENLVQDGQIVSMAYTLYVDGEVLDASPENTPLEFTQGQGQIIIGLERELYGMSIGEEKNVTIAAKDGYGEIDPEAMIELPKDRFPPNVNLQPGLQLQMRNPQGQVVGATIDKIEGDTVTMNLNHPLAGKELRFEIKIVDLRIA